MVNYIYDADGNRTRVTHPDGVYFSLGYDAQDRISQASWTTGSGTTPFLRVTYDGLGRRTDINRGSSYTGYGYDGASRLTGQDQRFAGRTGNSTIALSYDPAGQITSETRDNDDYAYTGAANGSRSYAVNGLNQYTSVAGAGFGYDANGNLISDGTNGYGYDAENRMVSASTANVTTLTYDPLGRLWQSASPVFGKTQFVYDGDHVAVEYDADTGGIRRRFMWGPGADEPILQDESGALNCSGTRFLHADHQGSIVAAADCNGNRQAVNAYDEYGNPKPGNWGRFQYTGQAWLLDLGLYYYKARLDSPQLGRFLQNDPVGYKDQINLYAYVSNDPVNGTDPTGMCTGSRIEDGNGTCTGTGEFTTGIQGVAQGMQIAAAAREAIASGLKSPEPAEQDMTASADGRNAGRAESMKQEALHTPSIRHQMERAWALSLPFDAGQRRTNEHGFYIDRKYGSLEPNRMLNVIRNAMSGLKPPAAGDVAFFHTHPFLSPYTQRLDDMDIGRGSFYHITMVIGSREGYFAQ